MVFKKELKSVLNGKVTETGQSISPDITANFIHAPITFVDVEGSFSVYKSILSDIEKH